MKKVFVTGLLCGAVLLGVMAARYEVPSGTTVIVLDSEWMDPFDPCDPATGALFRPPADWLLKHGNSLGSVIKFNVAVACGLGRKQGKALSVAIKDIAALKVSVEALSDPNEVKK